MTEFFRKITNGDVRSFLAVITVLGCFTLLYFMMVKEIPTPNKDVINIAMGFVFGSALTGVFGYYFGSSKSVPPADKDEPATP